MDGPGDENVHDGDFENDGDEVANAILRMAMLGTPILRIAAGDVNPSNQSNVTSLQRCLPLERLGTALLQHGLVFH